MLNITIRVLSLLRSHAKHALETSGNRISSGLIKSDTSYVMGCVIVWMRSAAFYN